jgi:hypothetical protein
MRCCTCGRKLTEDEAAAYGDQCDDCVRAEFEPMPELEQLERRAEAARSVH